MEDMGDVEDMEIPDGSPPPPYGLMLFWNQMEENDRTLDSSWDGPIQAFLDNLLQSRSLSPLNSIGSNLPNVFGIMENCVWITSIQKLPGNDTH